MKQNTKYRIFFVSLLVIQCILYILAGVQKTYIHMDEAYSLGLASYDKVEIQDNNDFYDKWHSKEYYEDYLSLQDDEKGEFYHVYENQKNDVHPPLYYLFLRIGMEFDGGHYNKWPGIVINIVIFAFIAYLMYLIAKKVLEGCEKCEIKAMLVSFMSCVTLSSLTNVLYIRMYALLSLFIVLTCYLHIRLYDNKNIRTMIIIGITALLGSLTHYYYLFFIFALYALFAISYAKNKDYKALALYTGVFAVAAILSLCIFPHSIRHMFFGYRGKGFIEKLLDVQEFTKNIGIYLYVVLHFVFNDMLLFIALAMLIIYILHSHKKELSLFKSSKYMKLIYVPTLVYAIIVAVASPYQELRYIMPAGNLIFFIVIYYLYNWMKTVMEEKSRNITFIIVFAILLVSPSLLKTEPQSAYTDKKDIVNMVENEKNVPTIYMFNSSQNRFLDDILLFSKLDESYIAKDMDCTVENIQNIFEGKDTSKGIVVFINPGQENDDLLAVIKEALSLEEAQYIKRLNACDVYYVK